MSCLHGLQSTEVPAVLLTHTGKLLPGTDTWTGPRLWPCWTVIVRSALYVSKEHCGNDNNTCLEINVGRYNSISNHQTIQDLKPHLEILSTYPSVFGLENIATAGWRQMRWGQVWDKKKNCKSMLYYPNIPQCQHQGFNSHINENIK